MFKEHADGAAFHREAGHLTAAGQVPEPDPIRHRNGEPTSVRADGAGEIFALVRQRLEDERAVFAAVRHLPDAQLAIPACARQTAIVATKAVGGIMRHRPHLLAGADIEQFKHPSPAAHQQPITAMIESNELSKIRDLEGALHFPRRAIIKPRDGAFAIAHRQRAAIRMPGSTEGLVCLGEGCQHFPGFQVADLHDQFKVRPDCHHGLSWVHGNADFSREGIGREAVDLPATGQLEHANAAIGVGQGELLRVSKNGRPGVLFGEESLRRRSLQLPEMNGDGSPLLAVGVMHGEELPVAAEHKRGRPALARQMMEFHVVRDAAHAAVALLVRARIEGVRLVIIPGHRIRRAGVPRSAEVKIRQGQGGDRGVAQLMKLFRGQVQGAGQLGRPLQGVERLETLSRAMAQPIGPRLGHERLPELFGVGALALLRGLERSHLLRRLFQRIAPGGRGANQTPRRADHAGNQREQHQRSREHRSLVAAKEFSQPVGHRRRKGLHRLMVEIPFHVPRQPVDRRVPARAILLQTLHHDPVEIAAQPRNGLLQP